MLSMITEFYDQATQDIYDAKDSKWARCIPRSVWPAARRKLDLLDAASDVQDLRIPSGNRLEKLKGDLVGKWSVRINVQYRIVFVFKDGNASEVHVVDYHG